MLDIILLIVAAPKIWLSICPKQGGMREGASLDFLLKTTKEWLSIYIQIFWWNIGWNQGRENAELFLCCFKEKIKRRTFPHSALLGTNA